jgi:hypothetical protein
VDEYVYLDPVPMGNIDEQLGENASIILPDSSQSSYFRYYSLYYRIYLSMSPITGSISEGDLNSINSTLNSDYLAIKRYTDVTSSDTNISPSNVEYTFRDRNYHRIALADKNIETILNNTTDGKRIDLDFRDLPRTDDPYLVLDGVQYPLRRSIDNPEPDNTLTNSSDLLNGGGKNDVVDFLGARECYVSLYIVKVGADSNFSQVYSFPTFIGIFRLPS